jgi:serine kinase of HPr protein (carbohydrate metabolism regulator)
MATRIHATCVALGRHGALLLGKPGSGKSDLALRFALTRLPDEFGSPALIADDQVEVWRHGATVLARAPAALAGKIEIRGVGIVAMPFCEEAELCLAVSLADRAAVPRMPDENLRHEVCGFTLPALTMHPFDCSAPLKLAIAIHRTSGCTSWKSLG